MQQYSLTKGIGKGLTAVALFAAAALVTLVATHFTSLYDASLWDLATQYLKPVLSTLTVGGILTFGLNWLKNRDTE